MPDLKNARLMYLKAALFVGIGVVASTLLLMRDPAWQATLLLALAIWGFCRAYYFAFYVIEHYVDGEYRFAGLIDFVRYLFRRR